MIEKDDKKKEDLKQVKAEEKPKIVPAKSEKVIKNMFPNKNDQFDDLDDELETVMLVSNVKKLPSQKDPKSARKDATSAK